MVRKYSDLRCIHRHSIDKHPSCFRKGLIKWPDDRTFEKYSGKPWYQFPEYRIGYFDIETDGLKADFSTMLSWAMKEKGGKVVYDVVTKKELFNGDTDKRIVKSAIEELKKYKIVCTYFGCVTPGHRVIKSDLSWVNVEDLLPGDKLLAFDEESSEGYRSRRFKECHVINNIPITRDVYEIVLENGEVLEATDDHPWLVQLGVGKKSKTGFWVWRTTSQLLDNLKNSRNNVTITKMLNVWDRNKSYESGYISAFFDSEGGVFQARKKDRNEDQYGIQLTASQEIIKNKEIFERIKKYLKKLDIQYSIRSYDKNNENQKTISVLGGKSQILEFLGKFNLSKKARLDISKLGRISNIGKIKVNKISYVGKKVVCGLETSSRTYIVEGFGSHNSNFDLPFLRSKSLHYGLDFPDYGEIFHFDIYYLVRSKLNLSRKSLSNVCDYLGIDGKTEIDKEVWRKAKYGDEKSLKEVLRHNIPDVEILEKLHDKLEPFRKWTRRSI